MDYLGIEAIKEAYVEDLVKKGETAKAAVIAQQVVYEQITGFDYVHPEEEPNIKSLNDLLQDVGLDIYALNKEIARAGELYRDLVSNAKSRLQSINEQISLEEERLKDLNIICCNYKEFDNVLTLAKGDFDGDFFVSDANIFSLKPSSEYVVKLHVLDIRGNGYEGNEYVLTSSSFLKEAIDTSRREFIVDDSDVTVYEYSRLTCDPGEKDYPVAVNFDQLEAQCALVLWSKEKFNNIRILSGSMGFLVEDLLISSDEGVTFTSVLKQKIVIDDKDQMYEDGSYIFGAGLLAFPATNFLKLILKSHEASADKIGFIKIITDAGESSEEKIVQLASAKRHVIGINKAEGKMTTYAGRCVMKSRELIGAPVDSIALFLSEYVPQFAQTTDCFKYILNVNGIDHEVVPINSHKNGTKIIKALNYSPDDSYSLYINESIKSATLTVILTSPQSVVTPYLSNIKICLGKAETKNV